jgi:CRISPR system Cascade subunit CasB
MNQLQAEGQMATLPSIVGKMAQAIEHQLSTGDLAELRRISPEEPYTSALWKMLLEYVPESWVGGAKRDEKESQWAALLMGMSMTGGMHRFDIPIGQALAEAGWSELRFVRLLRSRSKRLFEEVRRIARYLSSKSQKANWADIAQLLLNQDGEWAEKHRRRIARDYYRQLNRQKD